MASDKYALQRAEGWRVHHVLRQIDEMVHYDSTAYDHHLHINFDVAMDTCTLQLWLEGYFLHHHGQHSAS